MSRLPRIPLILLALASGMGARAAEPDQWRCDFCTYAAGWFGSLGAGPGWASGASPGFSDYRGIDDTGAFLSLRGDLGFRGEGTWLDVQARDLGTDNRRLEVRGGLEGRFRMRLGYREITRVRGSGTMTPFTGSGGAVLTLPAGWTSAPVTSGFTALAPALRNADLTTGRRVFDAGLGLALPGAWELEMDYRRTAKTGTRPFGAGVFTLQSSVFPAPVEFHSDRVELALQRSGRRGGLRLGFASSVFNNRFAAVTWQNPFGPVGNTPWLRAALEPDSAFRQFTASGVLKPARGLRLSGSASAGRIRQEGELLPYSINPDFEDVPLPRNAPGQAVDVRSLRLAGRLSARLSPRLDLAVRMRADERDNRTPVDFYTPVVTDLLPRPATPNRPYSFERRHFTSELGFRALPGMRLAAGFGGKENRRTLQSVRETQEDTWWGEARLDRLSAAQFAVRVESARRDTTPYMDVSDPGLQENPLMRKFNLAGLERDRLAVEVDLAPGRAFSASLGFRVSEDDYRRSALGLLDSEERSVSADLAWVREALEVHLFYHREEIESRIAGGGNGVPWLARTGDRFVTAGAGLEGRLGQRITFSASYLVSASRGRIATQSDDGGSAGVAPFPALRTRLNQARLSLEWRGEGPWGWVLRAEQERYAGADWQLDGLGPAGIEAILTLGGRSPGYSARVLRVEADYRF